MKLLHRPLLAMLAAAVLFAVYLWDVNRVERAILRGMQAEQVLFQTPDLVTAVVFDNEHGRMRVERPGGAGDPWQIVEPSRAPADSSVMNSYLENLRGARRQASFPPEDGDLARYGLEEPSRTVSVTLTENGRESTRTLLFGRQPTELGHVYAKIEGEELVFTVSEWFYRNSNKQLADIRDRSILPGRLETATEMRVAGPAGSFRVERPDADSERWRMVREGHHTVPVDRVLMERLTENLQTGRFQEAGAPEGFEDADHGLDFPVARLIVEGETLFAVGNRVGERDQFYAKAGEDTVGIVSASLVTDLLRPAAEWGTKRFVWFEPREITEVHTSSGPSSMQLLRGDDGDWFFAATPGVPVHPQRLEDFLRAVTTLSAQQLVTSNLDEEDWRRYGILEEGFRLAATNTAGQTHSLRFGQTDSREGHTYILREQDNSLWQADFREGGRVFKFRRDLEDRRIEPELAERTSRFVIVVGGERMTLEKTQAAWRVEMPGERPTIMRPTAVVNFLELFEAMESDGEMLGLTGEEPQATFSFYDSADADDEDPFLEIDLLSRTETVALFRKGERVLEVPADQFEPVDDEMVRLVLAAKAQAEQERTP